MNAFAGLLLLTSLYPLAKAVRANARTTLRQPLLWALAAWAAWTGAAFSFFSHPGGEERLTGYAALCLTGAAGVAVLGARRPGAAAWNFVVVGLLAVLLLPILNGWGEPRLESAQIFFLTVTLLVPLLNYLPTRLGPGVCLLAAGCTLEMIHLLEPASPAWFRALGLLLLAFSPWTAWISLASRGSPAAEFDRVWLSYRDRFGFVWGQRMREQFNRAAHHAGFSAALRWKGLQPAASEKAELLVLLRAVVKRFGPEEEAPPTEEEAK